jgi:hypothetical protein
VFEKPFARAGRKLLCPWGQRWAQSGINKHMFLERNDRMKISIGSSNGERVVVMQKWILLEGNQ